MAKSASDAVLLKTKDGAEPNVFERLAGEAGIYPGHVLELQSDDTLDLMDAGISVDGQPGIVALENDHLGKDKTTVYASGDLVRCHVLAPGDEFQVRVPAAAPAIVIGDSMELNGTDGTMSKRTTGARRAMALEAVDNSGGGAEVFCKVMWIR